MEVKAVGENRWDLSDNMDRQSKDNSTQLSITCTLLCIVIDKSDSYFRKTKRFLYIICIVAFMFMSRVVEREIVGGDGTRCHHFRMGVQPPRT